MIAKEKKKEIRSNETNLRKLTHDVTGPIAQQELVRLHSDLIHLHSAVIIVNDVVRDHSSSLVLCARRHQI